MVKDIMARVLSQWFIHDHINEGNPKLPFINSTISRITNLKYFLKPKYVGDDQ